MTREYHDGDITARLRVERTGSALILDPREVPKLEMICKKSGYCLTSQKEGFPRERRKRTALVYGPTTNFDEIKDVLKILEAYSICYDAMRGRRDASQKEQSQ